MNILGEVCMKKRLSVLLSIIIVLSICAPITSVMAEEARKQSILKTGKEIAALCNKYDNYNELDSTDEQTNKGVNQQECQFDLRRPACCVHLRKQS